VRPRRLLDASGRPLNSSVGPHPAWRMRDVYADLRAILDDRMDRFAKARALADALRGARGYHWVGLYDVTAADIRAIAWTGAVAPAFPDFPRSQGLNGAAVSSGGPLIVQDVARDPRWLTTFSTSKAEAIFPVVRHGVIVGTIDVESDRIGAFTSADEDFLRGAAVVLRPLWAAPDAV
jgi:L-methionine (R)-S-oxide reductase